MGFRANFILIDGNKTRLSYYGSYGNSVHAIFPLGPEVLRKSILNSYDDREVLMDNAFAEGGILIDLNSKKALLFDAELLDPPSLRREYIKLMQEQKWEGWDIKWAVRGNIDFAMYLDLNVEEYQADNCFPKYEKLDMNDWIAHLEEKEYLQQTLVTIMKNNIITDYIVYGVWDELNSCIAQGTSLYSTIPEILKLSNTKEIIEELVFDVILVDYDSKKIFVYWYWDNDDSYLTEGEKIWPRWEIKRQVKGVPFNFAYTNREHSYKKTGRKELEDYIEEVDLFYLHENERREYSQYIES